MEELTNGFVEGVGLELGEALTAAGDVTLVHGDETLALPEPFSPLRGVIPTNGLVLSAW